MDYSNSLLANANTGDIKRLQRIQNHAARVVLGGSRWDQASPLLKELHWLPVEQRIKYKEALFANKCLNNLAPKYLSSLITFPDQTRYNLRSMNDTTLL